MLASTPLSEHGSDRLRRGLATFVLELRDARAPTPPTGYMEQREQESGRRR